ncbi:hypothetical protein AQUCO_01900002v1 [Aquilegia coerulea]|uniref:Nucleolar protein 14 n=1 Tax=Aquilegia coerulea TaxID=218851 RepID=A0A2G5DIH5_AQUCA|nr:hypothetical protein AQUCO_01900002v1 [Aquilegia coerulea]
MAKTKTDSKDDSEKKKKNKNKKTFSKKLLSGPSVMTMKSKTPIESPFETIWSRKKFNILGKKRKGEDKRSGLSRFRAIEKRKGTLLKEYEQSGKSSVFLDKRIGEQNESLAEFDKAILRSQRARQLKVTKKSKFNLSDGEEDDDIYGSGPFSEKDDFEEELPPDDDADLDEMEMKSALLKHGNGSNINDGIENKQKSKKEVMEEIILKSKFFKAQKAKEKDENEELMEQLDKDFTSLVQSKALLTLTQPSKMNALNALVNKASSKEFTKKDEITAAPPRKEISKQEQPDDYDKLAKEMVLDMRARPSDRTKTPEEIAEEEKERLEQLEKERLKRMSANDDSSDDDDDDYKDLNTSSAKKLKSISGDDLGDSFSLEEESDVKKGWVDEILQRDTDNIDDEEDESSEDYESGEDQSDEEGENSEPERKTSLKDWEQSDDEKLSIDLEEGEEEEDEEEEGGEEEEKEEVEDRTMNREDMRNTKDIVTAKSKNKNTNTNTSSVGLSKTNGKLTLGQDDALPYVIEAPNSLAEFRSLVDDRSDSEVAEVIYRIRTCNPITIEVNRKKMQVFYGILVQYFAVETNNNPLDLKRLNILVKPLMEMSAQIPFFAAVCARQRLHLIRAQFCEDIKNPAILLMCEYLMRCPITSGRDTAVGSFLCSMVLSVARHSQKFYPEAVIFLRTLLMSALATETKLLQHSQFYYLSELKMLNPWLRLQNCVSEVQPLDFSMVMNRPESSPFFSSDGFRASVVMSVCETLRGFVHTYEEYNSFPEIFLPVSTLLNEVARQKYISGALQDTIKDISELIEKRAGEHHMLRQPLQMRKQKPMPIKLLNPKFEENFVKGRDYDPDRERAERRKLKKEYNRERKGAARELRKDNQFLYALKEKDRALREEERTEKYGKARAFLQEQEHAFKSGQLGKGRKRRR